MFVSVVPETTIDKRFPEKFLMRILSPLFQRNSERSLFDVELYFIHFFSPNEFSTEFTNLNTDIRYVLGNKNSANSTILDSWLSEIFILAYELFAKALKDLEICLSTNNDLCEKLVSS